MSVRTTARPPEADTTQALVALWCALWLVVGVWTGYETWQLSELSDTVAVTGQTLDEAGSALESLGSVPVVGETSAQLGSQVRQNAAEIVDSAGAAGSSVRRLSVLLGFTIALVPSAPVLVVHRMLGRRTGSPQEQ